MRDRRAYHKAYYFAHREEVQARHRAHYLAHREEVQVRHRAYNLTHREERREHDLVRYDALSPLARSQRQQRSSANRRIRRIVSLREEIANAP